METFDRLDHELDKEDEGEEMEGFSMVCWGTEAKDQF